MSDAVTSHYAFGGLRQRIEAGLAQIGGDATVASLGAVDEFHVGGRPATKHLIDQLELSSSDHVLDIGSGLGGTARFIASETGARVTGVDLTAEYVEVASWLTELVGLGDRIAFVHGSAEQPPPGEFTAATMVHVGMNIVDKPAVFTQIAAALEAGARFAIYDVMATGDAQPEFPTPWAATRATSAVETVDDYRTALEAAGFQVIGTEDRTSAAIAAFEDMAAANQANSGPPPLGLHLVMGPTTPTKIGNLITAIRTGVVAPTEIIARRT